MSSLSIINRNRQRGVIGLWGSLTLLLAVLFMALAVDSGRLWMQQRKLQSIADIASIQAARQLGCSPTVAAALAAAQNAAVQNGYTGSLAASPNLVQLGNVNTIGGIRQFVANAGQEAVRVYATQQVPASLVAGGLFGGTVLLQAQAVSSADAPLAAFSVGSYALGLDTEDSDLLNGLLGDTLGSSLDLQLISYQGLAEASVTLGDMLAASGEAGGITNLLNTQMQMADLIALTATALSQNSTANADASAALAELQAAANNGTSITLGDVLAVTAADADAASKVGINVLSLITTSALLANGQHAISLPIDVDVPGIASVSAQVNVLQPPQIAIGPAGTALCTTVRTAQIQAKASVNINLAIARLDLALNIAVAQGSAGLRSISDDGGSAYAVIDATPGIASASLTNSAGTGPAGIFASLPLLGNIKIAEIGLNLPIQPASPTELNITVPHPVAAHLPKTEPVSSPLGSSLQNALSQSNAVTVSVLNGLGSGIINDVVGNTVGPLLGEIGSEFLDPLLKLLGIRLGGLDVTLEGIQLSQAKPLII